MEMLEKGLKFYAEAGITTAQDGATSLGCQALLETMDKDGKLPIDVVSYLSYTGLTRDIKGEIVIDPRELDKIPAINSPTNKLRKCFRVGGVKLLVDGSIQGYTATAYLKEPYYDKVPHTKPVLDKCSDRKTEQMFLGTEIDGNAPTNKLPPSGIATLPEEINEPYRGYPSMDREDFAEWVRECDARNIQMIIHGNGDAGIEMLIDTIKEVRKKPDSSRLFRPPITKVWLSGLKSNPQIPSILVGIVRFSWPVAVQSLTLPSSLAEANHRLSGLNLTPRTKL